MTLKGYNFYLDGVKMNSLPQASPTFKFTGLSSDTPYEITTEAVDVAGNVSAPSDPLETSTLARTSADDPMNESDMAFIDSVVLAEKGKAAGVAISISGSKGYYTKAYGTDYTDTLTVDDKMHYGSCTKMYAALLICKQIDEGNLSFDDTLEMFEATKGVKYGNIITVKMLLMQRTGIGEVVDAASAFGQAGYLTPTAVGDPMPYIRAAVPQFYPDTQYRYCNSNYILLGEILRQLDIDNGTSRSVADILREDCFEPLELTETEWRLGPYMQPPFSRGWTDNPAYPTIVATITSLPLYWLLGSIYWSLAPGLAGGWHTTPTYEFTAFDPSWSGTAGCLDGTVSDLHKFGEALRDGLLLSPEMIQLRNEVFGPYATYTPAHPFEGPGWMGNGLGIISFCQWRGWNGGAAGYGSALWYNPTNGAVIAIVKNWYGPIEPWVMVMRIIYQFWPETIEKLDEWKVRVHSGLSNLDEFGSGTAYTWHTPGDLNGATQLPHKVRYYL